MSSDRGEPRSGVERGGQERLATPKIREATLEDHIVVDCRDCLDPMLLGKWWRELILEDGHEPPKCPDCNESGDEWADDADPVMDGLDYWALAGDVIREVDVDV